MDGPRIHKIVPTKLVFCSTNTEIQELDHVLHFRRFLPLLTEIPQASHVVILDMS